MSKKKNKNVLSYNLVKKIYKFESVRKNSIDEFLKTPPAKAKIGVI